MLEYLCVSISKGEGERWRKKSEHFGLDKSVRTSRDREGERKRSLVSKRERRLIHGFLRARTHTHIYVYSVDAHVYRDGIQDRVSIHLASLTKFRVYLLAWPVAGACAILILRSKFSTLRPATLLSCNLGTINLRELECRGLYLYPPGKITRFAKRLRNRGRKYIYIYARDIRANWRLKGGNFSFWRVFNFSLGGRKEGREGIWRTRLSKLACETRPLRVRVRIIGTDTLWRNEFRQIVNSIEYPLMEQFSELSACDESYLFVLYEKKLKVFISRLYPSFRTLENGIIW